MNEILEKFGVYDFFAVLLSGICICTFSLLALELVYEINIDIRLDVDATLLFFVISYFLGLIFQESGSIVLRSTFDKNDDILKKTLRNSGPIKSHVFLTSEEIDGVCNYVRRKLDFSCGDDTTIIYNYCKFYVLKNCSTTRIDKDQSLSAMSRSLSLYFILMTMLSFITIFFNPNFLRISLFFISVILSTILSYRCVRFAKLQTISGKAHG